MDVRPILTNAESRRQAIRANAVAGLTAAFPMQLRDQTIELQDVRVHEKDYGPEDMKRALLEGSSLHEQVKGTVVLKNKDGTVAETVKNLNLLHLPFFTGQHSFIIDGNEYQVSNQIRMKPGVYARRRANGELEAAFNLSKGANFRVSMDPRHGHPFLEYGSSTIPLYPVLRKLGVPHEEIEKSWGVDVAKANSVAFAKKEDVNLSKLYAKVIHPAKQTHTNVDDKVRAVLDEYKKTQMDPEINKETLGQAHASVTPQAMLDASKKLLSIYKSGSDVDDRDSLAYKTFHGVEDFVKERIQLDARTIASKIKLRAASKKSLRDMMPTAPFSSGLKSFITGSTLSAIPTQINPVEIIDHAVKLTSLGEGGIQSERAVPDEARNVHHTHLGMLDPVRTPESFKAGVDIRTAWMAHRDNKGNLYTPVKNVKTGKSEDLSVWQIGKATVAFPNQPMTGMVSAMRGGQVVKVPAAEVDYQLHNAGQMYSPSSNLIPFLESIHGVRATMGSKMQTQALPLVTREVPLVQAGTRLGNGKVVSFESLLGKMIAPHAPVSGKIAKIDHQFIYIKPDKVSTKEARWLETDDGEGIKEAAADALIKIPYSTNLPFASKTYLNHTLAVKEGDRVTEGQMLGDSNFTRQGELAIGKNMRIAYMPYHGLNSNDAVVISETAAKKLTSEHMYKEIFDVDDTVIMNRDLHRLNYGTKYTAAQYAKLDEKGVVKKGAKVLPHDPLIAALRKSAPSVTDQVLGNLKKSLVNPYKDAMVEWHHDFEGEVIDVYRSDKRIVVTVRTQETMRIGDKLSGRYGNKGVIAHILPDAHMIQDKAGKPVDILYSPAGVISRINPAQILETAAAKVAEKTGKPIVVESFSGKNNVEMVKELLKKHGVSDKEDLFDPVSGKTIKDVFVGPQYTLRLFKTTDSNYAARSTGGYDINEQPSKGGDEGAKGIGKLEFNALVAHNARNVLQEMATTKSQKSDEFWRAVQLGLPLPPVKKPFIFNKFLSMLNAAGVRTDRQGSTISLKPLTDADITRMSAGAIENEKITKAKDNTPERGGLFDYAVTGGLQGTKWSHINLAEPVLNPLFADPARRLLGMTAKDLEATLFSKGGQHIKEELNKLDPVKLEAELRASLKGLKGTALDNAVKKIKYLRALQKSNLKPGDAYVLTKFPVLPPVMRPVVAMEGSSSSIVGDSNFLYQSAILHNKALQSQNATKLLPPDEHTKLRENLYTAVGAVVGTHETDNPKLQKRNVQGFIEHLTGKTTPKSSFFQSKMLRRQQDLSGRGTAAPDGTLGMDQVGLPQDMLWGMFDKFVIARLVRRGFSAVQAKEMVEKRHPAAQDALKVEIAERPIMINRAPTLHRYSIIGAYAVPVAGKTIRVNPFVEKGLNLDYDGDTLQIHAPAQPKAVAEVKAMTLSNLVFGDRNQSDLMVAPTLEAVLGAHLATQTTTGSKVHKFKTKDDAMAAYKRNELKLTDLVEIGK